MTTARLTTPVLLFRVLASLPGGDELEDMGYETFNLGWHEADQLGRVLETIQDKRDVEDIVAALVRGEDEEEVEEPPRHRREAPPPFEARRRGTRPGKPPSYPAARPRRPAPESTRPRERRPSHARARKAPKRRR